MRFRCKHLSYVLAAMLFFAFVSIVSAAELRLAGLTLGSPALSAIHKYGNPTEVRVGGSAVSTETFSVGGMPGMAGPTGMSGPAGMPGMGRGPAGMPGMPALPAMGGPAGMPGMPGAPAMGGPAGMPGMMTGPLGAAPGAMAFPGTTGGGETTTVQTTGPPEVTWVYRFPKNRTLEVLLNPSGIIVQISVIGISWANVSTSRGIKLGNTYKDILVKYGYPESHQQSGIEQLQVRYPDKHHVVFSLLGKTCVGITIALM
jgi:hypothetical protein